MSLQPTMSNCYDGKQQQHQDGYSFSPMGYSIFFRAKRAENVIRHSNKILGIPRNPNLVEEIISEFRGYPTGTIDTLLVIDNMIVTWCLY